MLGVRRRTLDARYPILIPDDGTPRRSRPIKSIMKYGRDGMDGPRRTPDEPLCKLQPHGQPLLLTRITIAAVVVLLRVPVRVADTCIKLMVCTRDKVRGDGLEGGVDHSAKFYYVLSHCFSPDSRSQCQTSGA